MFQEKQREQGDCLDGDSLLADGWHEFQYFRLVTDALSLSKKAKWFCYDICVDTIMNENLFDFYEIETLLFHTNVLQVQ